MRDKWRCEMKYTLFFEYDDGRVDQETMERETIEELRNMAEIEQDKRNAKFFWAVPTKGFEM